MYEKQDPATAPLLYEATMEDLVGEIRRRTKASVIIYESDSGDGKSATTLCWWSGGWNTCMGLAKHSEIWMARDRKDVSGIKESE